jgi:hypothetical protein
MKWRHKDWAQLALGEETDDPEPGCNGLRV